MGSGPCFLEGLGNAVIVLVACCFMIALFVVVGLLVVLVLLVVVDGARFVLYVDVSVGCWSSERAVVLVAGADLGCLIRGSSLAAGAKISLLVLNTGLQLKLVWASLSGVERWLEGPM